MFIGNRRAVPLVGVPLPYGTRSRYRSKRIPIKEVPSSSSSLHPLSYKRRYGILLKTRDEDAWDENRYDIKTRLVNGLNCFELGERDGLLKNDNDLKAVLYGFMNGKYVFFYQSSKVG